ncbi:MAG: class I SAM-dependent methyltransferase [Woeseiaceae bacterium]
MSRFVASLYDALHAFEVRRHPAKTYPVHKTLVFDDGVTQDIYEWIIKHIEVPDRGVILDAGCGNGFGTALLAERSRCDVLGISISPAEIATAERVRPSSNVASRISFKLTSFDDMPADSFDFIVAVESLKHSEDLAASLATLRTALRPDGRLVIVDDCYSGPADNELAKQLIAHWGLKKLYTESDYLDLPESVHSSSIDLSQFVKSRSRLGRLKLRLLPPLARLLGNKVDAQVRAAFAGGAILERLYVSGQMQYKAMIISA